MSGNQQVNMLSPPTKATSCEVSYIAEVGCTFLAMVFVFMTSGIEFEDCRRHLVFARFLLFIGSRLLYRRAGFGSNVVV